MRNPAKTTRPASCLPPDSDATGSEGESTKASAIKVRPMPLKRNGMPVRVRPKEAAQYSLIDSDAGLLGVTRSAQSG